MFKRILLILSIISLGSHSIYSMNEGSSSSSTSSSFQNKDDDDIYDPSHISGSSIEELEQVFTNAPARVKNIVAHLKDPKFFSKETYRSVFLVGAPGVGKSTMAKAIGYQLRNAGWKTRFFTCADLEFAGENRNIAAIRLVSTLNDLVAQKNSKIIIIIDELNQLLENYNSKQYDTDMTSKALWTFLDKNRYNENFFFIGVMNDAGKIPQQLKSRHRGRC